MDVVDESCPDIFRRMQEKGSFRPPEPPEIPPMVTRVGPTSLQVDARLLWLCREMLWCFSPCLPLS